MHAKSVANSLALKQKIISIGTNFNAGIIAISNDRLQDITTIRNLHFVIK